MQIKTILAILSLAFGIAIFVPYGINIWKRTARPHILTWITWTVLIGLGFLISHSKGGGGGSWVLGLQSICCFFIAIYSIFHGEEKITRLDWASFISALIIAAIYFFTKQAYFSVILASTIDALGYVPTFRKSYMKPAEEPAMTYLFGFISSLLAIAAIKSYNLATIFYPLILVLMNSTLVIFLVIRRKNLKPS